MRSRPFITSPLCGQVTDYWGEPFEAPDWRGSLADGLDMPSEGIWPAAEDLERDDSAPSL